MSSKEIYKHIVKIKDAKFTDGYWAHVTFAVIE